MEIKRELFNIESQGIKIAVETRGQGIPLVVSHGLTSTRKQSLKQFKPLFEDYRIIALDQRGHGESEPVMEGNQYKVGLMADDLLAVFNYFNLESAILCGESMGAATALHFALEHPGRVKTLLISAPAFGYEPNSEKERFGQMSNFIRDNGMELFLSLSKERWDEDPAIPEGAFEQFSTMMKSHNETSIYLAIEKVLEWQLAEDLDRLSQLTIPVKMIAWPGDPLHPESLAKYMCSHIPDCQISFLSTVYDIFLHPENIGLLYKKMLES